MMANNSSGARSLKYGATRPHVLGLTADPAGAHNATATCLTIGVVTQTNDFHSDMTLHYVDATGAALTRPPPNNWPVPPRHARVHARVGRAAACSTPPAMHPAGWRA